MSVLLVLVLGVLQGLTEFLPVSSSGHLALAQLLVPGFSQPGLLLDLALHLGTVVSVLVLERERLGEVLRQRCAGRLALLLLAGTAATAVLAFPLRHLAERAFQEPAWIGAGFLLTAVLLLASAKKAPGPEGLPSLRQAVLVGLAQGVAVFPGLSRSGTTIAAALAAGVGRRWAADFSFLLAIPAIGGATLVEAAEQRHALIAQGGEFWQLCLLGALAAAGSGLLALAVVRKLVQERKLAAFAWYLLPLGALVLLGAFGGWWR